MKATHCKQNKTTKPKVQTNIKTKTNQTIMYWEQLMQTDSTFISLAFHIERHMNYFDMEVLG